MTMDDAARRFRAKFADFRLLCRPQVGGVCAAVLLTALFIFSHLPTRAAGQDTSDNTGVSVSGHVLLPDGTAADASTVVWLEAPGLHGKPLVHAVMDQRNKTFLPHVLVVTPGTRIKFPNNDTIFHNVFAEFEAKRFDLGMYPQGKTKVQTFDKPGVVALLCNIHPRMSAFILVVDSPYFTVADKAGQFDVKGVPPGAYTLRCWHESGSVASQHVTVAQNGDAALTVRLK